MSKVVLLTAAAVVAPGETEMHFGFSFTATDSGALECDMPAEFVESEAAVGRVKVVEDKPERPAARGGAKSKPTQEGSGVQEEKAQG